MDYLRVHEFSRLRPDGTYVIEPWIETPWYPVQQFSAAFMERVVVRRGVFASELPTLLYDAELGLLTIACMNGYAVYGLIPDPLRLETGYLGDDADGFPAYGLRPAFTAYLLRGEQDTLEPIPA